MMRYNDEWELREGSATDESLSAETKSAILDARMASGPGLRYDINKVTVLMSVQRVTGTDVGKGLLHSPLLATGY